jgi:hypothetical protein
MATPCCPTCFRPLEERAEGTARHQSGDRPTEALAALSEVLSTAGITYPEAAAAFGRSVARIKNLTYELHLPVSYGRVGSHPRRHAFLSPQALRTLAQHLSRPKPGPYLPR